MKVSLDFETFSECSLPKQGAFRYASHESTEVLCAAFSIDGAKPQLWLPGDDIPEWMYDKDVQIHAWNCAFEYLILSKVMNVDPGPITRWHDTMQKSLALSLPASLANCSAALSTAPKDKRGAFLIQRLCQPYRGRRIEDKDLLNELYEYCIKDVLAEQAIDNILPDLSPDERRMWELDQEINLSGVPLDMISVVHATGAFTEVKKDLDCALRRLTNVPNPNSQTQMLAWFQSEGCDITDVSAATLRDLDAPNKDVELVASLYQDRKKTPATKYRSMILKASEDNRLRGCFSMNMASTGRWSSRNLNFQNMTRNTIDYSSIDRFAEDDIYQVAHDYDTSPMNLLSSALRGMIKAPHGHRFIQADFSSIEAMITGFLTGQESTMRIFNTTGLVYEEQASMMFGTPVQDIDSEQRFLGKIAVLALGFGGGKGAFLSMAQAYGRKDISENFAQELVDKYRLANRQVCQFWSDMQRCAIRAVQKPDVIYRVNDFVSFTSNGKVLKMRLPSGRCLHYWMPAIGEGLFGQNVLTHIGTNSYTRKWERQDAWYGTLVENAIQAIANDVLRHAMLGLKSAGYKIVMHVHDEIVCEMPYGSGSLDEMVDIMTQSPSWFPDLPLQADGKEFVRYSK